MSDSHVRIVNKYPNRRLYDTQESRYITLNDVRQLVLDGTEFEILDKQTGEDITRSALLQVIAEQERGQESVMSEDFLAQVIRSCSGNMNALVGGYLERSLNLFIAQQQKMSESFKDVAGIEPFGAMTELAQRNLSQWMEMQKEILEAFAPSKAKGRQGRADKR